MNRDGGSLFAFYEVVEVIAGRSMTGAIVGWRGAVLGMARNDETGTWSYSVHMMESGESWSLRESELIATGSHMTRGDFYDGSSIRVLTDPETGEGNLSEP
ncbi:Imm31 family immunity protein [Stenotrophomonas aracearum]|jgi:hypothetical protein|uniref:Imm31 family immunity protein n=1 Tax=Stenotrophomonas aracearum TaxID=3003272 RepID=UPI003CCD8317